MPAQPFCVQPGHATYSDGARPYEVAEDRR